MIVTNLRRERLTDRVRLSADVVHETAPVPVHSIFFEVDARHGEKIAETYDPFLVAAFLPAVLHREKRVRIDGDVAPLLGANLQCVMAWHRHWYGERHAPIPIEAGVRGAALQDRPAAMYLSGGVDSMFTLRRNQTLFPASHPCRVKYAVLVNGFDVRRPDAFRVVAERVGAVAAETGLDLVVVTSNVPVLDDDYPFWFHQFGGAAFCSVAHALAPAIQNMWFSDNTPIAQLVPWSTHPATDARFSSADVAILNDGLEFSRLDKVRLLADWEVARRHLRVCTRNPVGSLNCGACEKCVRTQLELLVAGRLAESPAFPNDDVDGELVRQMRVRNEAQVWYERELVPELRAIGRVDLADAVDATLREYEAWAAWRDGTRLKHRVARALHLRQ